MKHEHTVQTSETVLPGSGLYVDHCACGATRRHTYREDNEKIGHWQSPVVKTRINLPNTKDDL